MSGSGGAGTGPAAAPVVLVLVGVGPRGAGLLERLVSNAAAQPRRPVEVHLVDPFPPGGGRVWRHDQSELLRLNTTAEDLTAFVDETVTMAGPVTPGPDLFAWCRSAGPALGDPALVAEAAALGPLDFPSRRLASAYLGAAVQRTLDRVPASMTVTHHPRRAVDLVPTGAGERDLVVLDDGSALAADAVVLLTSHVDVRPAPPFAALADFAAEHGLTYVPPGYGGDLDLDLLEAGQEVLVRGFGLGFVDLMVLLSEGRGGKFVEDPSDDVPGRLRYEPSGAEPRLLVGSRRGVPYHAKPMYRLRAARPERTTFCTPEAVAALLEGGRPITFGGDLWPLVAREVTWAYYVELVQGHPERVTVPWAEFAATYAALPWGSGEHERWLAAVVPDPADRLDLPSLDRPLRGLRAADREELRRVVRSYVRDDLARRQDQRFSADLGAFHGLLAVLPVLGPALGSPLMDPRSLVEEFTGWFLGFFSSFASGPPPDRLEQLLALEEAGVVEFVGPGLEVRADAGRRAFVGRSSSVPGEVVAHALLEATLPAFDLDRADDPLLTALAARGEAASQVLTGPGGERLDTGQLAVDLEHRLRRADGTSHPRRFALGMHTTVKSAAFARPGSNGPVHRHNDQVARTLLALEPLPAPAAGTPAGGAPSTDTDTKTDTSTTTDTDQTTRPGGH